MTKIMKLVILFCLTFNIAAVQAHKKEEHKSDDVKAEGLIISHIWAREGKPNSAAFMTIINTTDHHRRIVGAKADAITKKIELHDHLWEKDVMQMRKVDAIDLLAKNKIKLRPGGKHVMFFDLAEPLKAGQVIDLQLILDNGKTIDLKVPVKHMKYRGDKHKESKKHKSKKNEGNCGCDCDGDGKGEDKPCPCPGSQQDGNKS